jgi:hypothetical protein
MVLYSMVQYGMALYSMVQYNMALYSMVQYSMALHSMVQYSMELPVQYLIDSNGLHVFEDLERVLGDVRDVSLLIVPSINSTVY